MKNLKIVAISDTHLQHEFDVPDGDILIHSGDATFIGDMREVVDFNKWFSALPHRIKIFVAGNHDKGFDGSMNSLMRTLIDKDIIYLENSYREVEGLKIWGSPYTPRFYDWAFMKNRGHEIRQIWKQIPQGLDILITHGPPHGILDTTDVVVHGEVVGEQHAGCEELRTAVEWAKPKVHIFGHFHEARGIDNNGETIFINAAICNGRYKPVNKPIILEWNEGQNPYAYVAE